MSNELNERPAKLVVQDSSPIAYLMDTARFEHCCRIAKVMAAASLIPDHLKIDSKTKQALAPEVIQANCFMIVNQAFRWDFDPFNVAPETYVVGGKLAFQGKLVAAAINARAGLEERLDYSFEGKAGTDDFAVIVSGRIKGEVAPRTVRVSVGQAKTDNQMWKKDPEQKLIYTGAIKWARRHTPEVILGVLMEDEADELAMRNVTPSQPRPAAAIGNPYADAPAPPAAPVEEPAKPKRTTKAKAEATVDAAPVEEPAAEPVEEPAADHPDKQTMIAEIKESWREAEISMAQAEAIYRKAGLLEANQTMGQTTLEQQVVIWKNRGIVFKAEGGAQ